MPSSSKSSKRRKAAKRKKKKASITTIQSPPTNSQQGDNDLKTHVEKVNVSGESGDVSSPTSQDPLHQLMEDNKRDFSSSSSSSFPTSDKKPMLGGSQNGDGSIGEDLSHKPEEEEEEEEEEVIEVMEVVREYKTERDSENGAACIEYIESAKESGNGGSADSDSSSDAESQVNEEKQTLVIEEAKKLKEVVEDSNSVPGIVPPVDSVEQVVPVIEETTSTQVVEEDIPVEKVENSGSSSLPSKEIDEKTLPSSSVPPNVDTSNGGGQRKESEISESSQNQGLVSFVPPTVQPTSWKCCCGLFDVFTGSNR